MDREGDDVEEDAQQVQHEAEQHCLFTLIVVASRVRVNPLLRSKTNLWQCQGPNQGDKKDEVVNKEGLNKI